MLYILTDARTPALRMAASFAREKEATELAVHYAGYRNFVAPLQKVREAIKKDGNLLIILGKCSLERNLTIDEAERKLR